MTQNRQVNDWNQVPVYRNTGAYAREHGELEQLRASGKANSACCEAIEEAIRKHFDGMRLQKDAAKESVHTNLQKPPRSARSRSLKKQQEVTL